MTLSGRDMRDLYRRTVIVRKPTYGIVTGYHELPYICLGTPPEKTDGAMAVRGKIQVSPRFVIRPEHLNPSYAEIFGEENVDVELAGRMFGFLGFPQGPVECKSEYLSVENVDKNIDELLSNCLDELDRHEDITTGVIITPDTRYYPVSLERFIAGILDDEFRT